MIVRRTERNKSVRGSPARMDAAAVVEEKDTNRESFETINEGRRVVSMRISAR